MSNRQIEINQRKIAKALKTLVHPSNPLAVEMNKRYRELEQLKT
jgi:hypothetical protein